VCDQVLTYYLLVTILHKRIGEPNPNSRQPKSRWVRPIPTARVGRSSRQQKHEFVRKIPSQPHAPRPLLRPLGPQPANPTPTTSAVAGRPLPRRLRRAAGHRTRLHRLDLAPPPPRRPLVTLRLSRRRTSSPGSGEVAAGDRRCMRWSANPAFPPRLSPWEPIRANFYCW